MIVFALPILYREEIFILEMVLSNIQLLYFLLSMKEQLPGYLILYLRELKYFLTLFLPNFILSHENNYNQSSIEEQTFEFNNSVLDGLATIF